MLWVSSEDARKKKCSLFALEVRELCSCRLAVCGFRGEGRGVELFSPF